MINNLQAQAQNEYSAGFSGTPYVTWGLFFFFAVTMVVFTLAVDQWIRGKV
jgi:hypothetical protein